MAHRARGKNKFQNRPAFRRLAAIQLQVNQMGVRMKNVTAKHVSAWHDEISVLDDQISVLQDRKKQVYAGIRRDFDRRTAEAMKVCMRLAAMDERQRAERLQFDELGLSFLNMIKPGGSEAQERGPLQPDNDDWVAQRERDRASGFDEEILDVDPKTGEIIDAA